MVRSHDDGTDIPVRSHSAARYALVVPALIVLQALILLAMGRVPMCTCGTIKLWHGVVHSSENSQHIFDWYSFTHVLHGFWLYLLAWLVLRRAPVALRLVLAVLLEGAWEVLENSDFIIERYRAATISLDYYGDSIVNSVSDTVAMMFGFLLARMLPVEHRRARLPDRRRAGVFDPGQSVLNILMLIYPFDAIKTWQAAARVRPGPKETPTPFMTDFSPAKSSPSSTASSSARTTPSARSRSRCATAGGGCSSTTSCARRCCRRTS